MKTSMFRAECTIVCDGKAHNVPQLRDLPAYVKAIHWDDKQEKGFVEFIQDSNGRALPNFSLSDFKPFAVMADYWREKENESTALAKQKIAAVEDADRESQALG